MVLRFLTKVVPLVMWKTRLAKGTKVLYANALNGTSSSIGVMPAKGGNASLSETEVKAAVDYILAKAKTN
ncbi:MAG: hypothetical protein RL298_2058 [Pseudomonadota bacterium]